MTSNNPPTAKRFKLSKAERAVRDRALKEVIRLIEWRKELIQAEIDMLKDTNVTEDELRDASIRRLETTQLLYDAEIEAYAPLVTILATRKDECGDDARRAKEVIARCREERKDRKLS